MTRGRKPDSEALVEAKGNPGKRRRAAVAVEPGPIGQIKPLSKLTPSAVAVWKAIAPDLERMNFIRATDRELFGRYCQTVVEYWEVTKALRAEQVVYWTETNHGKMKRINPLFAVQDRLAARLMPMEDRLGLSPQSRQQIMLRLSNTAAPQLPFDQPAAEPDAMPEVGFLATGAMH